MNMTDRKRLNRLNSLMTDVPFPAIGTQSARVAGFVSYVDDMRQAAPVFRKIIQALIYEGLEGYTEGDDYENVDALLNGLEAWVKARGRAGWQAPTPSIQSFIDAALTAHAQSQSREHI